MVGWIVFCISCVAIAGMILYGWKYYVDKECEKEKLEIERRYK